MLESEQDFLLCMHKFIVILHFWKTGGMACCSFVLASSFRTMAGFLYSFTQVVYRVKMAILRDYLGVRECTILINYHETLVNVAMRYQKGRLQVFLNSQTRSPLLSFVALMPHSLASRFVKSTVFRKRKFLSVPLTLALFARLS